MATSNAANIPTGTSGTVLQGQGAGTALALSTATYPATTTVSQILYSSSANVVSGLATANDSVLITNSSGVPALGTSLDNNFTFTDAASGGTELVTISQTSNSASANAQLKISTAGATAADPTVLLSTTTTNWIMGVDNSVTSPTADPFVISQGTALGTTNIMSVATSGEINLPLQPAFLANLSAAVTDVTGDGTAYTIVFNAEIYDQNADFDTATGIFTAPVTGRYLFTCPMVLLEIGSLHNAMQMNLVTSNRTSRQYLLNPVAIATGTNIGLTNAGYSDMDAGDTAFMQVNVSGSTKTVDVNGGTDGGVTFFGGALIC